MKFSTVGYAVSSGLVLMLAACNIPLTDKVDWSGMNYVAQECGEDSKGTFTNPQCKSKNKQDDLTTMTGYPQPGHR